MFNTPVLLIIFNRLNTTQQVFNQIKEVKPKQLFIAADGPRKSNITDAEKCSEVRDWVIKNINWECNVQTLFQETNLGCGRNPATAITWFFEHVDQGIILEDDCIPSISFFKFCEEILEKYKFDKQMYVVSGTNFQKKKVNSASYYFSAYGNIWGWATWKRAWDSFNYEVHGYDVEYYKKQLSKRFKTKQQRDFWFNIFLKLKKETPSDIWDYQWCVSQFYNNAISICPNKNLVSNIGFGEDATHTKQNVKGVFGIASENITEIKHPRMKRIQKNADLELFYNNLEKKNTVSFSTKLIEKIRYELSLLKK